MDILFITILILAQLLLRSTPVTTPPPEERLRLSGDTEIYRFFGNAFISQNELSWSRTQILFGVEAGILTASFSNGGLYGAFILFCGTVLICKIWRLILRDWQLRDYYQGKIEILKVDYMDGTVLAGQELRVKPLAEEPREQQQEPPNFLAKIWDIRKITRKNGSYILASIVWWLIFLNAIFVTAMLVSECEHPKNPLYRMWQQEETIKRQEETIKNLNAQINNLTQRNIKLEKVQQLQRISISARLDQIPISDQEIKELKKKIEALENP